MASSSMSPAGTSFGRLLKSSKVVSQFDASIPLVYTTYGGSKKRSDYGLKRALPKIKTAAIRVHSLDNSMTKLTDFSYAARERCFVDGFRESNVKMGGYVPGQSVDEQRSRLSIASEGAGACAWDKRGFQSIEDLKRAARTGASSQVTQQRDLTGRSRSDRTFGALIEPAWNSRTSPVGRGKEGASTSAASTNLAKSDSTSEVSSSTSTDQQPQFSLQFAPDYLQMSERQFNNFLSRLETLQPKFLDFLRSRNIITPNPERQQLSDILKEAGTVAEWGGIIDDFLAQEMPAKDTKTGSVLRHDPKLNHLETSEHYAFGLTYATPNLYMADQATRPLPVRHLDTPLSKDSAGFRAHQVPVPPATVLGTLASANRTELPDTATKWQEDVEGNYSLEFGRGEARVEFAGIQHPSTKEYGRRSPDEQLYGVDVSLVDNPSKKPTIMDEDVIQLKVYKAGEAEGSLKPTRIGSPEWVRAGVSRIDMEELIRMGDTRGVFGLQDSQEDNHQRRIRPPGTGRYVGEPNIKNRKSREHESAKRILDTLTAFNRKK